MAKSKTVAVKSKDGKTHTVVKGSKAEKKYTSAGGTVLSGASGAAAKTARSNELKALSRNTPNDTNVGGKAYARNSKGDLVPVLDSDRNPLDFGAKGTINETGLTVGQRRAMGELSDAQERGTRAVETAQPSPTTTEANPYTNQGVDYETAQANLAGGGLTGNTLAMAQQSLAGKYGKAFSALSGSAAPQQFGEALSAMSPYIQQDQNTMVADQALTTDPTLQMLAQATQQFLSPEDQKTSLMQEYSKLYKKSGIEKLDEEIIDAETIIDGTEDDIRNEVQMAGGMATDSQVQAMAIGRNKGLLKRYNQLVSMREQSQTRLDMMMNLTVQDRQMAMQKANMQLDAVYKFANFRMQVENNVKEGFNAIVSRVGYKGAYEAYSKDPRQLAMIERSMGLGAGGLANLASQKDVELEMKEAQLANEWRQASGTKETGGLNGVDLSGFSLKSPTEAKTVLSAIVASADLKPVQRNQITKALAVLGKVEDLYKKANDKGEFAGTGWQSAFRNLDFTPGKQLTPESTKAFEGDVGDMRQALITYITGAAYTSLQEKDVNKYIPQVENNYETNRIRMEELTNSVIADIEASLVGSGVNTALPRASGFFESGGVIYSPDGQEWIQE